MWPDRQGPHFQQLSYLAPATERALLVSRLCLRPTLGCRSLQTKVLLGGPWQAAFGSQTLQGPP